MNVPAARQDIVKNIDASTPYVKSLVFVKKNQYKVEKSD